MVGLSDRHIEEEKDICNDCEGLCTGCSNRKILTPEQRKEILDSIERTEKKSWEMSMGG